MDDKLKNIIRRYLSSTFDGERENCRSIGGQLAIRFGLTFDQAVALLHKIDAQPTKTRRGNPSDKEENARREAELKARYAAAREAAARRAEAERQARKKAEASRLAREQAEAVKRAEAERQAREAATRADAERKAREIAGARQKVQTASRGAIISLLKGNIMHTHAKSIQNVVDKFRALHMLGPVEFFEMSSSIERDLLTMTQIASPDIETAIKTNPDASDREIARRFKCSPTTVGKTRHRLGLNNATRCVRRDGKTYKMRKAKQSR